MQRYLSISDLAERAGITVETARTYGKQGRLPGPDVLVGLGDKATRGWTAATIDAWLAARPGKGGRPRLKRP
nr:transcriptional regulator [Schaalia georgiae]